MYRVAVSPLREAIASVASPRMECPGTRSPRLPYDLAADVIDELFGAFDLLKVAGPFRPVFESDAEAAAVLESHARQLRVHDAEADRAHRPFQVKAFHHLQVELKRLRHWRGHGAEAVAGEVDIQLGAAR